VLHPDPRFQPEGSYVRKYDPAAHDGMGDVDLTLHMSEAKRFDSMQDALDYWRQQHGLRLDGKPNRPLTAFTVNVVPIEQE
jgi:hypothetical protein